MQKSGMLLRQIVHGPGLALARRSLATATAGPGHTGNKTSSSTGFFSSFFEPRQIQVQDGSHSQRLSAKEEIVELQTHNVKSDCLNKYTDAHKRLCQFFDEHRTSGLHLGCLCVGNFNVFVGQQDQFIHLWRFENGYQTLDKGNQALTDNPDYRALRKDILSTLSSRSNQYLMTFSYWPEVALRDKCENGKNHIYEMRSYDLKPGTMVEWGNYWAKAIRMRDYKNTEAFMGTFSQVGELYNVKHIWCYDSLVDRQKARDVVWTKQQQQWSEIVSSTMPLVKHMSSSIMYPMDYSPTK